MPESRPPTSESSDLAAALDAQLGEVGRAPSGDSGAPDEFDDSAFQDASDLITQMESGAPDTTAKDAQPTDQELESALDEALAQATELKGVVDQALQDAGAPATDTPPATETADTPETPSDTSPATDAAPPTPADAEPTVETTPPTSDTSPADPEAAPADAPVIEQSITDTGAEPHAPDALENAPSSREAAENLERAVAEATAPSPPAASATSAPPSPAAVSALDQQVAREAEAAIRSDDMGPAPSTAPVAPEHTAPQASHSAPSAPPAAAPPAPAPAAAPPRPAPTSKPASAPADTAAPAPEAAPTPPRKERLRAAAAKARSIISHTAGRALTPLATRYAKVSPATRKIVFLSAWGTVVQAAIVWGWLIFLRSPELPAPPEPAAHTGSEHAKATEGHEAPAHKEAASSKPAEKHEKTSSGGSHGSSEHH